MKTKKGCGKTNIQIKYLR